MKVYSKALDIIAQRRAKKKMNKDIIDEDVVNGGYISSNAKENKKEKINYSSLIKDANNMAKELRKNKKK